MAKVEFAPYILRDAADIYSFRIEGEKLSEFGKFLVMIKDVEDPCLLDDFNRIVLAISKMSEDGVLENFFRNEGSVSDRVVAIPLEVKDSGQVRASLRLYCIRLSDKLLIVGSGGIKKTRTYQEDKWLLQCVETLQKIDKELMDMENEGIVLENEIMNIILEI
ncbi:MAG: hypothetical protein IKS82_05335 [Bacteroidales bacterium]|nr:hypothetical protein [Bacteroidales bacterium]